MANFGTALIRQDSLRVSQSRKSIKAHVAAPGPTETDLATESDEETKKRTVLEEHCRRILKEASSKRLEPFSEDFVKTLETLRLDIKPRTDVKNTLEDGIASSVVLLEDTPSTTASESEVTSDRPSRRKNQRRLAKLSSSSKFDQEAPVLKLSKVLRERSPAPMRPTSLLIASLGNPPPYHSTRHSAAHLILKHLQASLGLPPFTLKSRPYGGGHVSVGADIRRPEVTLWQSPSLMNVSGPPLLKAWKNFVNVQSASPNDPVTGLIVLHDEMETESGTVKAKRGNTSPRGHNGIKSVQASFQSAGLMEGLGNRYVKIGIGIGRPTSGSRDSRDVSAYVLGQLTPREKDGLENATSDLANLIYQEMARIGQSAS